jgi:hypothetical protein
VIAVLAGAIGGVIPFLLYAFDQRRHRTEVAYEVQYFESNPQSAERRILWSIWNRGSKPVKVEGRRGMHNNTALANDAAIKFAFGEKAWNLRVDIMAMPQDIYNTIKYDYASTKKPMPLPKPETSVVVEPFTLKKRDSMLMLEFWITDADELKTELEVIPKGRMIDVNAYRIKSHTQALRFLRMTFLSTILGCMLAILYSFSGHLLSFFVLLIMLTFLSTLLGGLALVNVIAERRRWWEDIHVPRVHHYPRP